MPEPTKGAQRISLSERFAAFRNPRERVVQADPTDALPYSPGIAVEPSPIMPASEPRKFAFPPSVNTNQVPRGEYPLVLTPFDQLRRLARAYEVASICIETRINWLTSVRWSVVARDRRQQKILQPVCNAVETFFKKPDGVTPFTTWLRSLMLEQLEIDALTLYKQRNRAGDLLGLEVIDGSTIKPLLDGRGRTSAYQQIMYGYVRGQYRQAGMDAPDPWPVGGDLMYLPRWTSTDNPYGRSPTEQLILRINIAIRKELRDLNYFTDGNIPAGFMSPPQDLNLSPSQVREFEDAFNADLQGSDRAANMIKFMPWKADYAPTKPFTYSPEIDMAMLELACASYHIPKNELGMTDAVNKASSQEQEDVAFRHAVGPDTSWLKNVLLDPVIHEDLGFPELEWDWNFGKAEDEAANAQTEQADVQAGIISATESRRRRYPDLDGDAPGPPTPPAAAGSYAPITAVQKAYTGSSAMIALIVPQEAAQAVSAATQAGLDPSVQPQLPEDLHVTLVYLGKIDNPELAGNYFHLKQVMESVSSQMPVLEATLGGIGRFKKDEGRDTQALWAQVDCPGLSSWRQELVEALGAFSVPVPTDHDFTPHMTLAYLPRSMPTPMIDLPDEPIRFENLTLCWGENQTEFSLRGELAKADVTVSTDTGLVNNDLSTPRKKRKRNRRRPAIDVPTLIESEAPGALAWAKKAREDGVTATT